MSQRYEQAVQSGATRFSKSPVAEIEFSRMTATPTYKTTYNAGDIVPIACWEVLPNDTFKVDVNFVNRLASAVLKPTMGEMQIDLYAYFVPNRIVNESWKAVQGENTAGAWAAPEIELAPLYSVNSTADVQIPVGSVADYYGYPTQLPIKAQHLKRMHDMKLRGYLCLYNEFFRDQNYQPPIPFSKLNVYQGFLDPKGSYINLSQKGSSSGNSLVSSSAEPDGSFPDGAFTKAVFGEGSNPLGNSVVAPRLTVFSALDKPLKANKLHDAFTSVLPSPQKGPQVYFGVGQNAPVSIVAGEDITPLGNSLKLQNTAPGGSQAYNLLMFNNGYVMADGIAGLSSMDSGNVVGSNLKGIADLSAATGISVNDLRLAVATQQVYEVLARSGSRYRSVIKSMFGVEADDPFSDIPQELGHIRRNLDLYQVAQTSASQEGNTPQGDLAAFGYTANGGEFFDKTFLEHGYIHILCVVRHRNSYSTFLHPDNFRRKTLDYYNPVLANIGEQPVRTALLNPFIADSDDSVLGYQEAWWEYRYQPDMVSGMFRCGLNNGLDIWTYADPFDSQFKVVDGDWLKSNSQEVLDRSLAVTSAVSDQFLGQFAFKVTKQRPMPVYSIPGLDTI